MKNLKPDIIVFAECCYENNDRTLMWQDITATLQILFRLGYQTKVYADNGQSDVICIEYIYQEDEIASGDFVPLTFEQIDYINSLEDVDCEEESRSH